MVSRQYVEEQLGNLGFNVKGWGRSEVAVLHNIILPDEKIYEVVNGVYEGGFAMLLATDIRVLLVDKKVMGFLTVEDLRFDMINEIDYNHRLLGAYITIATGNKTMTFRSYNKTRLHKLIGHVQHEMAETKKKQSSHAEGQNQRLEQINQQLQAYLLVQNKQQQKLQEQLEKAQRPDASAVADVPQPIKPSPELADYLYARGLLQEYEEQTGQVLYPTHNNAVPAGAPPVVSTNPVNAQLDEIYADGMQEVFGKRGAQSDQPLDTNPLKIASSKLPTVLRRRRKPKVDPVPPANYLDTLNLNSTTSSDRMT